MISFLNRYIDWKKNIKFEEVFEFNFLFDFSLSENIVDFASTWVKELNDSSILSCIEKSGYEHNLYKNYNYKNQFVMFESHKINVDELIGNTIYSPTYNVGITNDQSKDYKSSYINLISRKYPQKFIDMILNQSTNYLHLLIISNPTNTYWDKNTSIGSYKFQKGINIIKDPASGRDIVDITKRNGRIRSLENYYFKGGSEYYFGSSIFDKIPAKKILSFKNADKVEQVNSELIYVKLFEEKDYWKDFAQQRLADFVEALGIDNLERQYLDKIKKL